MRKKLMCVFLLLFLISFIFATEISDQELGNAKKLLYETARILELKNNMVVVDEISKYDWLWASDPLLTAPYINMFNDTIKENKSIEQKRQRLEYLYNQNKASLVSALVPNALHFVNIAMTAGNPLRAMIAIGGASLSSVSSYVSEKQKQNLELIQKEWELDDSQVDIFESLSEWLRTYLSKACEKYGITNDQLASVNTLRSFIKLCSQYDYRDDKQARELLLKLDTGNFKSELAFFPEYWGEIAKAAYGAENYELSLQYIDNFEDSYVKTMYHDENYSQILKIKAYCLLQKDNIDIPIADELCRIADSIYALSPASEWADLYFCVELYEEMKKLNNSSSIRAKQIRLMEEVVDKVADEYKKNVDDYIRGVFLSKTIEGIDNNIQASKDQIKLLENEKKQAVGRTTKQDNNADIEKLKEKVKVLEKNKAKAKENELQMLPPNSSLLYSIFKQYKGMLGDDSTFTNDKTGILSSKCSELLCDVYSQQNLFDAKSDIKPVAVSYTDKWLPFVKHDPVMRITIPATYFVFTSGQFNPDEDKLSFVIGDYAYTFSSYSYEVDRAGDSLDKVNITFTCKVKDVPEDTGLKVQKDRTLLTRIIFESNSMQIDESIIAVVDNLSQMLKGFKVKEI